MLDGVLVDAEVDVIVDESEVERTQRFLTGRVNGDRQVRDSKDEMT